MNRTQLRAIDRRVLAQIDKLPTAEQVKIFRRRAKRLEYWKKRDQTA